MSEFDKESFITEALNLHQDPLYMKVVEAILPNNGESLEDICRKGLSQYLSNSDSLDKLMTEL